ncbi:uncharacterized protein MONBRDRAFT_27215 [Monosiga brevicollis MX1]|uniref:Tubulin-specific chaperone A n=1 Tax=Monosiga brevicollis TaxID=81824 RepID=A9V4M8_MONBE|nr:uncharacterized protein MONBRDRAFT_27215 [Monosiga brevicollis MX1]EDQ87399.1 predicted protein [Monosiga brevicollis MX1]|eukprot:XP_001747659.1 hypothetical protein [Monosiga brevicollis MX1]
MLVVVVAWSRGVVGVVMGKEGLGKEREYNFKEIAQQEARIEKYKAEGRDEYDVRKQYEVLEECKMMVPNTQQRLEEEHKKLTDMVVCQTARRLAHRAPCRRAAPPLTLPFNRTPT